MLRAEKEKKFGGDGYIAVDHRNFYFQGVDDVTMKIHLKANKRAWFHLKPNNAITFLRTCKIKQGRLK